MEFVGAALGDNFDDGAVVAAILWGEVIRDDAEFLRRVWIQGVQSTGDSRYIRIVVVHAVENEVVAPFACSIYRKSSQLAIALYYAWAKQHQRIWVPGEER